MEVTIKRSDLVQGLYLVQGVVDRRSAAPGTSQILANVLIEPCEGGVALSATDLEVGLRGQVTATVGKKGVMALNARKLYEIAREVSADEVVLRSTAPGWVEVSAGRSKFKVVSPDPKDFPELPLGKKANDGTNLRVAGGMLREMIDKTIFAVSDDETRFNLSGVFMEVAEGGLLRLVATDGHRLALVERALGVVKLERGVIMPRKGLGEIRKLLEETDEGELSLVVGEKDLRLVTPKVSFFMRLVEGEFPDYRQVIPRAPRVTVRLNRDDFLAALKRTSLLASERSQGVRLHFERGVLELSASNPEQGEAQEEIEVSYAGDPLTIGFNGRYLIDALLVHAPGDVMEFGLTDEVGPGLLRGTQDPEYSYVVMPVRL